MTRDQNLHAERLAALRARKNGEPETSAATEQQVPSPNTELETPIQIPETSSTPKPGPAKSRSRSRVVVGSLSGVTFVATAAAMGPVLVNADTNAVSAEASPTSGTPNAVPDLDVPVTTTPDIEVVSNYIYVDENGDPLSEQEVADLRTAPIEQTPTPTVAPAPVAAPVVTAPAATPAPTATPATAAPATAAPAPATAAAPITTAPPPPPTTAPPKSGSSG